MDAEVAPADAAAGGDQARILETLLRVNASFAAELDEQRLLQVITDAVTEVTGAAFGAFFYNVVDENDEAYMLYTLSGVPREAFAKFPMPRNTRIFAPTFEGTGVMRLDDVTQDPRYGHNAPHKGMPKGHLPVRSYLAVPVVSRTGRVHGGLFLGHPEPARFGEQAEQLAVGIAAQAAVALDNARLYKQARESEARFRVLADTMPQMVWYARPDGHTEWLNRVWHDYTGQGDEAQGDGWTAALHPDDHARALATWREATRDGKGYEILYRLRRASDGEHRWHLARATPMRDEQGAIVRWFGTCTDIHEQKVAEEEMARVRAELLHSEKMSALGSLVSGVAHEVRTPLTYLANNLHLIERAVHRALAAAPPEAAKEAEARLKPSLEEAHESIERINRLVEDLRRYTRLRAGAAEPVALTPLVAEASRMFLATHRGAIRLETQLEATPPVRADRVQVQQVVLNLLENALDAEPRDATLRLRLHATPEGGARLEVEDRGRGIPPEVQARMWDPFFTTKSHGTGLGLSIVKRIADAHGASLACRSAPGEGTTIALEFPPART